MERFVRRRKASSAAGPRPSRRSSKSTMVQKHVAKGPPGKERGESHVFFPMAGRAGPGEAGAPQNDPKVGSLLSQASRARLGCGQPCPPVLKPAQQGCIRALETILQGHFLSPAEVLTPLCHLAGADPNSRSSLSGQPRQDQTRRRPWRQRAQDSGSQTVKPIRLNRVPLLCAETSSPSTATQEVPGLSQGMVLVKSSSSSNSSLPCPKQGVKRRYPKEATEPQTPESPLAKRRRIDDVSAQRAKTCCSSATGQVASRLRQDAQSSRRQAAPCRRLWLFPGPIMDLRSQPGPVRMRHTWRQQRRVKKPYSRPENQSRTRRASAPGARPPHPSK